MGQKWQRVLLNSLPGLNKVHFIDNRTGFLLGDGSEQLPSGLVRTTDGGRSWRPVPGPRSPSWLDGDFQDADTGALTGAWSHLSILRDGSLIAADVDPLGGRNIHAVRLLPGRSLAVGGQAKAAEEGSGQQRARHGPVSFVRSREGGHFLINPHGASRCRRPP